MWNFISCSDITIQNKLAPTRIYVSKRCDTRLKHRKVKWNPSSHVKIKYDHYIRKRTCYSLNLRPEQNVTIIISFINIIIRTFSYSIFPFFYVVRKDEHDSDSTHYFIKCKSLWKESDLITNPKHFNKNYKPHDKRSCDRFVYAAPARAKKARSTHARRTREGRHSTTLRRRWLRFLPQSGFLLTWAPGFFVSAQFGVATPYTVTLERQPRRIVFKWRLLAQTTRRALL